MEHSVSIDGGFICMHRAQGETSFHVCLKQGSYGFITRTSTKKDFAITESANYVVTIRPKNSISTIKATLSLYLGLTTVYSTLMTTVLPHVLSKH